MVSVHAALPRRLLGLWLTGVYVFALVGSFVHRIEVEHVPCADHGEFVHTATSDGSAGSAGDTGGRDAAPDEHEHDHCVLAALGQTVARTSEAPRLHAGPWPPTTIEVVDVPPVEVVRADEGRYRLAPKGSPPLAI